MDGLEKSLNNAKWFAVGLLVLTIIIFFITLSNGSLNIISIISFVIQLALIIGTIAGCNKQMKYGPICGIIFSILMILSFNIINIIFGVLFLIDCIKILKEL